MTILTPEVLNYFPRVYKINDGPEQNHLSLAFGYGSGVFKQKQDIERCEKVENQIDLILVVKDSLKFHEENLKLNAHHYSFLQRFGVSMITDIQEHRGARIYFNPYIRLGNDSKTFYKYGTISRRHLIRDLFDWETLYVAGRLQV